MGARKDFQNVNGRNFRYEDIVVKRVINGKVKDVYRNDPGRNKKLKDYYGAWEEVWRDHRIGDISNDENNNLILKSLFGDFEHSKFEDENIVQLDLAKDPELDFRWQSGQRIAYLKVNKVIIDNLRRALKKVRQFCQESGYVVYDIQGYNFRYKEGYNKKMRYKVKAVEDRQSGKLKERLKHLSNHALGTAIDINPPHNWIREVDWDMPAEIVKIMREEGFYWGGNYRDAMHFEYKLPYVDTPRWFFPFAPKSKRVSPLNYYYQNESTKGGYYPVSLYQMLHGGIHLQPEGSKPQPVRALSAGYIVAARLMRRNQAGDNPVLQSFVGNRDLGFVLIRHEIQSLPKEKSEPFPLYSLYMHLMPPGWEDSNDPYSHEVKWFQLLRSTAFGGAVDLDPDSSKVGQLFWAESKVEEGTAVVNVGNGRQIKLKNGDQITGHIKSTPEDIREAIEGLKKGAITTFHQPYLTVERGDIIGYTAKCENDTSGFIHWELFSPAGDDSGVKKLLQIDSELGGLFKTVTEAAGKEDNFYEMPGKNGSNNELEAILRPPLPDEDKTLFDEVFIDDNYGKALVDFFKDDRAFARDAGLDDDAGTVTGNYFTYPVTLNLRNKYEFNGNSNSGSGPIKVKFFRDKKEVGKPGIINITDFNKKEYTLFVPANADSIKLEADGFYLDSIALNVALDKKTLQKAKTTFIENVIAYRWRNVVFEHVNEWTEQGLNTLLDKLDSDTSYLDEFKSMLPAQKKEGSDSASTSSSPLDQLKEKLKPLVWWGRKASEQDEFGEIPILGANEKEVSIFDGSIFTSDSAIDSIHPVSGLWLLDQLESSGKINVVDTWQTDPGVLRAESDELKLAGWVAKAQTLRFGERIHAVAIYKGYASGHKIGFNVNLTTDKGMQKLNFSESVLNNGVACQPVIASFWGKAQLEVTTGGSKAASAAGELISSITVEKPQLDITSMTVTLLKNGHKATAISIKATQNCPKVIQGYVYLRYVVVKGDEAPVLDSTSRWFNGVIPVRGENVLLKEQNRNGIKYKGGYIVGTDGKKKYNKIKEPGGNFTYQELAKKNVFEGSLSEFKLHEELYDYLQGIRDIGKVKDKSVQITVKSIKKDGLSMVLKPSVSTEFSKLVKNVEEFKTPQNCSYEKGSDNITLVYTPPEDKDGGMLMFTFDPSNLFNVLANTLSLGEGEKAYIQPVLLVPNGGHTLVPSLPEYPMTYLDDSCYAIKEKCKQDFFEFASSFHYPPFENNGLGTIKLAMGKTNKLYTTVELKGDINGWKSAKPKFQADFPGKGNKKGDIQRDAAFLSAEWDISKHEGKTLNFGVSLTDETALPFTPRTDSVTFEVVPKLAKPEMIEKDGVLKFTGQAHCIPTDTDLRFLCKRKDESGNWVDEKAITDSIKYQNKGDHYGFCDDAGLFEAFLDIKELSEDTSYKFIWVRPFSGKILETYVNNDSYSVVYTKKTESDTSVPQEGATGSPTIGEAEPGSEKE